MASLGRKFILIFFIFYWSGANAQDKPIGYWESLLPYNSALGVATDGNTIYTICNQAFFTYNVSSGEMQTYSKASGMSDIGMESIGYDYMTTTAVLCYADGNIDLFKDNAFYNIPDYKTNIVPGVVSVNQAYTENGMAYLSTYQGILVIDLKQRSIYKNYQIIINNIILPINSFAITDSYYYAATAKGLYRVYKNDPLIQVSSEWQNIDYRDSISSIVKLNYTLFFSNKRKVFTLENDTPQCIYTAPAKKNIQHIDPAYNYLIIGEGNTSDGVIKRMNFNYRIIDSFDCATPTAQATERGDSSIWIACPAGGLQKRTGTNATAFFIPDGPSSPYCYDLYAYNRDLWIAHGGYDEKYFSFGTYNGLSNFNNDKWTLYKQSNYAPLNGIKDISSVIKDETNGILYAGSYINGLFTLHPDGANSLVDQTPPFDGSYAYGPNAHQIISLALDKPGNLWLSLMFAPHQLYVKTRDSIWYDFAIPGASLGGPFVIDDSSQLWLVSSQSGGVFVYNTNNTLSDISDDKSYHLTAGIGIGNLPSNQTNCIAKDLDNKIWIGTDNGIGIAANCNAPFSHTPPCDVALPIVQYGQNPGYLFAGYNITSIAVDGANRKWVGTDDGLWLLSPDASQIIYAFTKDNSPLPSNVIMKITIDKITGDVYIGTDQGLVSYRGAATDGGSSYQDVLAFPNPVPSGYTGTIAIKGLIENADVRITDITGQLVYRTTALGGQAIWNGMDYTGHRPQSGVYLIFISNNDGRQSYMGKIVFIQ